MASAMPQLPSNPNDNDGPKIKRLTIAMCVISTLFIVLRVYVRHFIVGKIAWDDYLMVIAGCANIAAMVFFVMAVEYGLGQHIGDVMMGSDGLNRLTQCMFYIFVTPSINLVAQVLVKSSIALTLLRIATQKRYRYVIIGTTIFMVSYLLAFLFLINLNCKNIRSNWDQTIVPRECLAQEVLTPITYAMSAFNIFTDLMFAIVIPFPIIWSLQMNLKTKASAMGVIALGAVACSASIARMPYLVNYGKLGDLTWDMAPIAMWSVVETEVSFIAACIPALRPLFKTILDNTIISYLTKHTQNRTAGTNITATGYPDQKQFYQIGDDQSKNDDFESASSKSDRGLVSEVRMADLPTRGIHKTTTSTVVSVQGEGSPTAFPSRAHPWSSASKY